MAKIVYIGESGLKTNSGKRIGSIERIGHELEVYDPYTVLKDHMYSRFFKVFHYRTGYLLLQKRMEGWIRDLINSLSSNPDLVWINSGELLGPTCIKLLKNLNCPIILYNNDDPTGRRDGRRFDSLIRALPYYSLCAVLRNENIEEYKTLGAKNVIRVYMSYDEVEHKSIGDECVLEQFKSDVTFIGTWMAHENRDAFLLTLIQNGINVSIWGSHWQKSPLWNKLNPYYRGGSLSGRDYVAAIQGAKICLGFLSKKNRDLHTRRSVEIPFIGGLFCAERTSEHSLMYKENEEAVFWTDVNECVSVCKGLLGDENKRERIRAAGKQKVLQLGVGNEDICRNIVDTALDLARCK